MYLDSRAGRASIDLNPDSMTYFTCLTVDGYITFQMFWLPPLLCRVVVKIKGVEI